MSEQGSDEAGQGDISDDQLPEDLQPDEDNPLAVPLDPDDEATKSRDELEMDASQEDLDATRQVAEADEAGGTDEF